MEDMILDYEKYMTKADAIKDCLDKSGSKFHYIVGRRSGKVFEMNEYIRLFELEKEYRDKAMELKKFIDKKNAQEYITASSFVPLDHRNRRRR